MKKAAYGISIGLAVLAAGFLTLGVVLKSQADFSKKYVHDQLAEKQIYFTPVENLLPNQKDVPCLVENAGKQMLSGKQAECYAKYQIGLDLLLIDNGKTYFEDHYAAYLLRVKTQQALAAKPDAAETQALVKQSAELSQKAEDIFDGETMRGLLLTAYGFSLLGERGATAATACFVIAVVLMVGAGFGLSLGLRGNRQRVLDIISVDAPVPAVAGAS
jgi:hypothetical protein